MNARKFLLPVLGAVAAGLMASLGSAHAEDVRGGGAVSTELEAAGPATSVFRSDGTRQCEARSGVLLEEMQEELVNAGVAVLAAACGEMAGIEVLAVCGGPTKRINIFTIRTADLERTLALGFAETADLPPGYDGARWRPTRCH